MDQADILSPPPEVKTEVHFTSHGGKIEPNITSSSMTSINIPSTATVGKITSDVPSLSLDGKTTSDVPSAVKGGKVTSDVPSAAIYGKTEILSSLSADINTKSTDSTVPFDDPTKNINIPFNEVHDAKLLAPVETRLLGRQAYAQLRYCLPRLQWCLKAMDGECIGVNCHLMSSPIEYVLKFDAK